MPTGGTNHDDLIDISSLATKLGVGERYVRRLVQERRVPFLKVGHYIRFDPREIGPWLDEFRRPQLRPTRRLPRRSA